MHIVYCSSNIPEKFPIRGIEKRKTFHKIRFYLRNWTEGEPGYLHNCLKFLLNLLYNLLFILYCYNYGPNFLKPSVCSNKTFPLLQ